MDLRKNFTTDVSVDKDELVKFCKSSASGSRYFLRILQHCEIRAFLHNLNHISGKTDRIFVKIFFIVYVSLPFYPYPYPYHHAI